MNPIMSYSVSFAVGHGLGQKDIKEYVEKTKGNLQSSVKINLDSRSQSNGIRTDKSVVKCRLWLLMFLLAWSFSLAVFHSLTIYSLILYEMQLKNIVSTASIGNRCLCFKLN